MEDLRFSDGFCTTSFGNNPEVDGEVSEAAEACWTGCDMTFEGPDELLAPPGNMIDLEFPFFDEDCSWF